MFLVSTSSGPARSLFTRMLRLSRAVGVSFPSDSFPATSALLMQTTCADALTTADWVPGLWSPKVHHGGEVDVDLLHRQGWEAVLIGIVAVAVGGVREVIPCC